MNFSNTVTAALATALNTTIGASAKLEFYTGTQPTSPGVAPTGSLIGIIIIPSFTVSGPTVTVTDVPLNAAATPAAAR